jgi:hypothetical protein
MMRKKRAGHERLSAISVLNPLSKAGQDEEKEKNGPGGIVSTVLAHRFLVHLFSKKVHLNPRPTAATF